MTVKIVNDTMCQRSGMILLKDVILYNVLDLSGLYYGRDKKGEERAVLINDAAIVLDEYETETTNPVPKFEKGVKEKK